MNTQLKVITVLGTRPEIIRLSRVIQQLDQHTEHLIVHTGQNSDYQLNDIFFENLGVRKPNYFLNISRASLGTILGEVLMRCEEVFQKEKPDAVLILGDTNSAIAALIARRMQIPVYHMEAGNRCFDANVPEETNRKMVDHLSHFNLVYTEHARRNLLHEGLPARSIYLTGSPMKEVLEHNRGGIEASQILKKLELEAGHYFIVSAHRAENVDAPERLTMLLDSLVSLSENYRMPVVVSTHPRTKQKLDQLPTKSRYQDIRFLEPFGFHDYIQLQAKAFCTISDSGTISEESAILNFPAITIRDAIERPEALDTGDIILTGLDKNTILSAVQLVTSQPRQENHQIPSEYAITNTSERVTKLILGTAKLALGWQGIRKYS